MNHPNKKISTDKNVFYLQVVRIILATFRNILEKVEDREIVREAALQVSYPL